MTFAEAKQRLKEVARGRYHSVEYDLTEFAEDCGSRQETTCTLYIDGEGLFHGPTFEDVFALRNMKCDPQVEEMPTISDMAVAA